VADPEGPLLDTLRDRYVLERELGRGGMATVYQACDLKHDRLVALKVLHPELAATLGTDRFLREIHFTARLDHPHILPVFDSGEAAGILWYTMPYVEGESLRARLEREGQLPLEEALQLAWEVADALDYAHQQGIVHRDIKPENVLLSGNPSRKRSATGGWHARVADFGVARALEAAGTGRLTETGLAVGTPAYMSPEQATGGQVDARSDVYSLGCVLYEMLAGEPPYTGPTAQAIIAKRFSEPIPHASTVRALPPGVDAVVSRALARAAADRWPTASRLAGALRELLAARPADTLPPTSAPRPRLVARHLPSGRILVGLGVLALLVLGALVVSREVFRAPQGVTLVVLPFDNLGSPDDEYFADGLTEEITSRLANISGLAVIGRASALQYKGSRKTPREIVTDLHVTHLLSGTVRWEKAPDGTSLVRVSPQLVRASDQTSLWSEPYEAPLGDVFRLQASVAERVARALDVTLLAGERQAVAGRPTNNLEAYDAYLRGLALSTRSKLFNDEARSAAAAELVRATALDPGFAAAWARLARVYLTEARGFGDTTALFQAEASARRAYAIDSTLLESRIAMSSYLLAVHDPRGASRALAPLLKGAPTNAELALQLGLVEDALGRPEDALASLARAAALDPRSENAYAELAQLYNTLGRHEEAIRTRDREIELAPDNGVAYRAQGVSYVLWRGDTAAARREFARGLAVAGIRPFIPYTVRFSSFWLQLLPQAVLDATDTLTLDGSDLRNTAHVYYLLKARRFAFAQEPSRARTYYDSAARVLEPAVRAGIRWERFTGGRQLALAEAELALGRAPDALRDVDAAVAAARRSPDVGDLRYALGTAAALDARDGRRDLAVSRLEEALRVHALFSPALLRLDPTWTALRGQPAFERMISQATRP
jgi:serine/threonine-protein kinase